MISSIKYMVMALFLISFTESEPVKTTSEKTDKIQILLVGFAHWNKMQNGTETANMFSSAKQKQIELLTSKIQQFEPEAIMLEFSAEEQKAQDSLYDLYKCKNLDLETIEYGASETYQVGFRLAKKLNHDKVYGIDYFEMTSQSLLKSGKHIELFQQQLDKLKNTAGPMGKLVQEDKMSLYDFTKKINEPEMIELTHHLMFNLPAYVQNGEWDENGKGYRELSEVEKRYAGAEYISEFYDRNLKIYSNILNVQMNTGARKIYVMMGQAHIGVLKDLLEENPNYEIVDTMTYLN